MLPAPSGSEGEFGFEVVRQFQLPRNFFPMMDDVDFVKAFIPAEVHFAPGIGRQELHLQLEFILVP
jgi:hypothetical protein